MKSHRMRAKGGNVEDKLDREEEGNGKVEAYDAKGSNVEKEADERKKGGRCERKRGGRAMEGHRVEGKKAKMHLGRPGRKAGGRVGSDKSPLSSAHDVKSPSEHRVDD